MLIVQKVILNPQSEDVKSSKIVQWIAGAGKTVGLIIKVLKEVDFTKNDGKLQGLVLVPTDYLEYQIHRTMNAIADFIDHSRISNEVTENLRILITTPQKAIKNGINVSELEILAIDEMNFMLEIGTESRRCIKRIFSQLPKECEILCTGTRTLPIECYMHDEHLKDSLITTCNSYCDSDFEELSESIIERFVYCPKEEQKLSLLRESFFQNYEYEFEPALLFCNTYTRAEQYYKILKESVYPSIELTPQFGKPIFTINDWNS
ncbi:predicted protein [Naegleria gruberi]|uniref:ATP-dependent RNA helicase n=1 Tax=Naegleria gruberi TaxID=5762 RepID=D2VR39_NAEGR|nr:uncharacterized protein NAEGRDRAFT_71451 [Naegleria gruberi]EFC40825.1 predicted protein [Naegleria gruberi]|eukprot:XP_002673569.1 predicted protein [Naegleria gruberi strain NEG-M]